MKEVTKERLNKYIELTKKALEEIKINDEKAEKLIEMSKKYYEDALHFKDKEDFVNAFAAINYSHAFLDSAALLGFIDNKDDKLFMVD